MSAAERLLPRLEGVRQIAEHRWTAKCPAHADRSPSLSIRETDDGRLLIHDFGGCASLDVLAAVGLTISDLFPERITHHGRSAKPNHWHSMRQALQRIHREALIVAIAGEMITRGEQLTDADVQRLAQAVGHVRAAAEVCS